MKNKSVDRNLREGPAATSGTRRTPDMLTIKQRPTVSLRLRYVNDS